MPNRTEMLHFRATPEEKAEIVSKAGEADMHLSEWLRTRAQGFGWHQSLEKPSSTQPVVEEDCGCPNAARDEHTDYCPARLAGHNEFMEGSPAAQGFRRAAEEVSRAKRRGETYEQFMERRVPELCGENPSVAEIGDAEIAARAEWAER